MRVSMKCPTPPPGVGWRRISNGGTHRIWQFPPNPGTGRGVAFDQPEPYKDISSVTHTKTRLQFTHIPFLSSHIIIIPLV